LARSELIERFPATEDSATNINLKRHFPGRMNPGGFIVLGAIVEAAPGEAYAEYVEKHIFAATISARRNERPESDRSYPPVKLVLL
jgi:hypothetical protein